MAGRLDGKVALVTGASLGLGAATARRFHAEGARVFLTDILDAEGEAIAAELGAGASYFRLDVASEADWAGATRRIREQAGHLDVLVNNAAIANRQPLAEMSLADYSQLIGINQTSVFLGMRDCIPLLRDRPNGASIINVSSIAAVAATTLGQTAYAASKWAVTGMTKVAAAELGPFGIRVNSVHPAHIVSPMSDPTMFQMFINRSPLRKLGDPDAIAWMMVFLASDESSYSTGSEFYADGGSMVAMYEPERSWKG